MNLTGVELIRTDDTLVVRIETDPARPAATSEPLGLFWPIDAWREADPPVPPEDVSSTVPVVQDEELLDVAGAAAYLGLGETAFRRIARQPRSIPHSVAAAGGWRFKRSDLDAYLEAHARVRPGDLGHLTRDEAMAAYRAARSQAAQR